MVEHSHPYKTTVFVVDYYSFDNMDLCWQSDISAFDYAV